MPFDLTTPEGRNAYAREYREKNREQLSKAEKDRYRLNKALGRSVKLSLPAKTPEE